MKKEIDVKIDNNVFYSLNEAIDMVKKTQRAKFTETVDLSLKLGIDPRKPEQHVKGAVSLPHGFKSKVVLSIVDHKDRDAAKEAGADHVGADEYIDKIKEGWLDFDVVITTPEMMPKLAKVGKILGTKGLMPNVKFETVTKDFVKAIKEFKKGKISFKNDKFGLINAPIGKSSFSDGELRENFAAFVKHMVSVKPSSSKGQYLKKMSISLTMGPGIKLDPLATLREISQQERR